MATNVVMPKMGESITEGTILRWLKKEGDTIEKDEPILEISTDKVDTEVPSPVAGTLLKILAQEKQTVNVGEPIASIGANGEASSNGASANAAPSNGAAQKDTSKQEAPRQAAQPSPAQQPAQMAQPAPQAAPQASQQAAPQTAGGGDGQAVVMPKMGESITEGTILRWLKKEGEKVEKDEPILEISTDKVDTEVPAPLAGTLTKIVAKEKDTVAVGSTIAFISNGAAPSQASNASQAAPAPQQASAPQPTAPPQPTSASQQSQPTSQPQQPVSNGYQAGNAPSDGRFYSPLVKSIAKEEGIPLGELANVRGSGLGGRVNKSDMLTYVQNRKSGGAPQQYGQQQQYSQQSAPQPSSGPSFSTQAPQPQTAPVFQSNGQPFTVIPMDNIRQKIAEHMVRSSLTSAHVTSLTEVDVTNIVNFRTKKKDEFKQRYGVNLTYTPILIEAMVKGLKEFPFINASIEGTNIVVKHNINFGVAVSLPQQEGSPLPPALIVPVIKNADRLNIAGLAGAVADLANKARTKKLTPDDISGGTFTLTNPGMYGNLIGTPIINQPQLAIMTTGAIVKRVVVRTDAEGNDYMAIRSMMFLGMSYDHRLIDGMYAVQFTERVKQLMESFTGEGL